MNAANDHPDVVARPPLLYLAGLAGGFVLELIAPSRVLDGAARWIAGAALVGAGAALLATAMRTFSAAGTNVPTPLPALALVTHGCYRWSRNPIYISLALVYAGIAILGDSLWALLALVPVLIVVRVGVVGREERYLDAKFGEAYRHYCRRTRRWL